MKREFAASHLAAEEELLLPADLQSMQPVNLLALGSRDSMNWTPHVTMMRRGAHTGKSF